MRHFRCALAAVLVAVAPAALAAPAFDADTLDGFHAGAFSVVTHGHELDHVNRLPEELAARPRPARNVLIVSKDGDLRDPAAAVASIKDASPTNPYLVKVMPGVYDLTSFVLLPPYVQLEGSGRGITVLRGSSATLSGLYVVYADRYENEVRDLTIVSDGIQSALAGGGRFTNLEILVGGTFQGNAVGIHVQAPAEIRDVRILVQPVAAAGWAEGFAIAGSPVKAANVDVTVVGPGGAAGMGIEYNAVVHLTNARLAVTGVTVAHGISPGTIHARDVVLTVAATGSPTSAVGILAAGESVIANSSIDAGAGGKALGPSGLPSTFLVSGSKLVGQLSKPWAEVVFRCSGNFDAAYAPVVCPAP